MVLNHAFAPHFHPLGGNQISLISLTKKRSLSGGGKGGEGWHIWCNDSGGGWGTLGSCFRGGAVFRKKTLGDMGGGRKKTMVKIVRR